MEELNPNLLSWAVDLEDLAREQAERTSRLPFLAGPVALMPDAHWGMGATVGSVIATSGAIVPAAVGVDIGCGMIAAQLHLTSIDLPDNLDGLHARWTKAIPAGVGQGHLIGRGDTWQRLGHPRTELDQKLATAMNQLGSLGSGNHFVELCLDEDDGVWIVLHSGSRGIGNKPAMRHIERAKGLMALWFIALEDPDLAYLPEGSAEFNDYIADLLWCQDYALLNRELMMDAALDELGDFLGGGPAAVASRVNCHHNYTTKERHNGRDVWITRKGAIRAGVGDRGVIPGSMGTSSFIVEGAGNRLSYSSCSHGAGRRMSRGQARRTLDVDTFRTEMAGKTWNEADAVKLIDEDPRSYKDIDRVMAAQTDLAVVTHRLNQILNVKGT